ncbi:hypothetical protein NIES3585_44120 [Nodularia sp. NIES-3585]|nr:hypothetical protein NIES3585_44120 [Nodularia sp. NIES-3585]
MGAVNLKSKIQNLKLFDLAGSRGKSPLFPAWSGAGSCSGEVESPSELSPLLSCLFFKAQVHPKKSEVASPLTNGV